MKKIFLWVFSLSILLISCGKHDGYQIEGKITNAEGRYIYLDELNVSSKTPVDSFKIGKDGSFLFKGTVNYPTFFLMRLSETNFITLLVDTADHVSVFADAANFSRDYVIIGSEGSELIQELNNKLSITKHKLDSIVSLGILFKNKPDYKSRKTQWDKEYAEIFQEQVDYSTDFVNAHPFSMASVLALYQKIDESNYVIQDLHSLKVVASALSTVYPESEHVKALYQNTKQLMSKEATNKLKQIIDQAGQSSPEVKLPTPEGDTIALSSLKGKYVLLQFWAAVDKSSRIQNEALVELYSKYHRKGLEIYQVSVDKNRYDWIEAIDRDKLSWINVGDMEGSKGAVMSYNIQAIPFNYLIDKDGAILARNLTGPNLNKVVGEALK